ncbi:DUF4367 domain-containing protein [Candidatus Saccharibacteria bacterium]|nr:DUF4367 domain-containing protein [Candidatus Saccharibacteria bacterium]
MAKITVNVSGKQTPAPARPRPATSSATHRTLQPSTTFSRKYVRRPDISRPAARPAAAKAARPAGAVRPASAGRPAAKSPALSAKEAKDKAVKSAMRSVATMERADKVAAAEKVPDVKTKKIKGKKKVRRVILALACSAATVGLLAFFINANMPDISVRVAAIQTGIEASYPTYIPRGYSLKSVTSEKSGQIVMRFENDEGKNFALEEAKSTWDSTALLNNYVKVEFSGEYTTLREQGITIYVYGSEAAWVNGGIFYHLSAKSANLSKEQIRNLVVSL